MRIFYGRILLTHFLSKFREGPLFGCDMCFFTNFCMQGPPEAFCILDFFLVLKNAYRGENLKKPPMPTSSHFSAVIQPAIPNLVIEYHIVHYRHYIHETQCLNLVWICLDDDMDHKLLGFRV